MSKQFYTVKSIHVGLRFKTFRITDIAGEIIDEILYSNDTPFGPEFFPSISAQMDEKVLTNEVTGNYLLFNPTDLVFKLNTENINSDFDKLNNTIYPFILKLAKKFELTNIQRIGVVFRHENPIGKLLDETVKGFSKEKIIEPNEVKFSFSKKIPTKQGLVKSGLSDHNNLIFTFSKAGTKAVSDFDYQKYFDPVAEDIDGCEADDFLLKAKSELQSKFYDWLREYLDEKE